jgi:8-oxo-dGTP pyrophosphatase MutT (NUDIX family)
MTDRVRALLVTDDGELLTIKRIREGRAPYWVLPGGGIESGESHHSALTRELREELAAVAHIGALVYELPQAGHTQYFYAARARSWSFADRSGPEFNDPSRGIYQLDPIPLSAEALEAIDLRPEEIAELIRDRLRSGIDPLTAM